MICSILYDAEQKYGSSASNTTFLLGHAPWFRKAQMQYEHVLAIKAMLFFFPLDLGSSRWCQIDLH